MDSRKRTARACDECRRMKEKCEGGTPCKRCLHLQRFCKRGLSARTPHFKAYVPVDQMTRTDLRELIVRSGYMERILKRTFEGIELDEKSLAKLADSLDADRDNVCAVGSDSQEVEELSMDDEACTMDPVGDNTTHFSGEFSYWNFSMRLKQHIEQVEGLESQHTGDRNQGWDFPRARQLRPGSDHLSMAISCCPPQPIAEFLTRNFFKYVETHYFLVEKNWILQKMNILYVDRSRFTRKGGEAIISILLTVFAIGSQYAHLESSTSTSASAQGQNFSEEDIGAIFYQQAVRLLPEIIELSSLESVQACLLFGYYALPVDTSGLGYIYVNLAIRLAMQNGMHRRCKNTAFSTTMVETRNRVWWTAYLLERKISIFHGRPLSVLRGDVDATPPLYRPELDLETSNTSVTRAGASIKLIHFLEDLFENVKNLRSCHKHQIPRIISNLLSLKSGLGSWWSSLSQELLYSSLQPVEEIRSVMHLQLEYCLVRMFIGRPFLLKKDMTESVNNSPENPESNITENAPFPDGTTVKHSSSRKELVDDCIKAATEALDLLQELQSCGLGLARASYIEYSSCRASLLVLIAYSIQNFSERFRIPLCKGLDMIREMSAAGESARYEVSLIETLEQALARLHYGAQLAQQGDMTSPEKPISDYDAFKHWGTRIKEGAVFEATNPATGSATTNTEEATLQASHSPDLYTHSYDEIMNTNYNHASISSSNRDMGLLGALDPIIEMPFFGTDETSPSAAWPTWTETQVLEQFLMNPEYSQTRDMDMSRQ